MFGSPVEILGSVSTRHVVRYSSASPNIKSVRVLSSLGFSTVIIRSSPGWTAYQLKLTDSSGKTWPIIQSASSRAPAQDLIHGTYSVRVRGLRFTWSDWSSRVSFTVPN